MDSGVEPVPTGSENCEESAIFDCPMVAVKFELLDAKVGSQFPERVIEKHRATRK
jgi:hypothetical protein